MKSLIAGLILIALSTLCFYLPSSLFGLAGFDVSLVPARFYQYFSWMMAGTLALNVIYASYLLYWIPGKNAFLKIPVSWLVIGETYTLIYHVINKIYLLNVSNRSGKIATIAIFSVSCTYFVYQAVTAYRKNVVRFKPARFFRAVIYTSSILFFMLGFLVIHFGTGSEVIAAICLSIPFSSIYVSRKTVILITSYMIAGTHLFFLSLLTILMITYGLQTFYTQWFVLVALLVIISKREKFFMKIRECH